MPYKGGTVCISRLCSSKANTKNVSMFRIPKDSDRAQQWLKNAGRKDLLNKTSEELVKNYRLCELHFEPKRFTSKPTDDRKRLLNQAVPTLFAHADTEQSQGDLGDKPLKKVIILSDMKVLPVLDLSATEDTLCSSALGSNATKYQELYSAVPGPSGTRTDMRVLPVLDLSAREDILCSSALSSNAAKYHQLYSAVPGPSGTRSDSALQQSEIEIIIPDPSSCNKSSASLMSSVETQTASSISYNSPRKEKLRHQVKSLKRKLTQNKQKTDEDSSLNLEDFDKMCDKYLSKDFADIVKSEARMRGQSSYSRRYKSEFKQLALKIYFLGPKVYDFLSKLLCLPTKRTLEYITSKICIKPGLDNDAIFQALELKGQAMNDLEKHCTLCIDEMSVKSFLYYDSSRDAIIGFENTGDSDAQTPNELLAAQNVCVFMIRGIYSNYKQPIAYFFVNSQMQARKLRPIVEDCILKLTANGFSVDALVTDMGSNFIELARLLSVTIENSVFKIGSREIVYLFDPCHLIKATRNNLLTNVFSFGDKTTSWSFIECFYNTDQKHTYRLAPKLTNAHLYPSNFQKMKVKLATQVLSHTVASGMNTYVSLGALTANAQGTIELVDRCNKLFDILNSTVRNSPNKFKKVFQGQSFQVQFLGEMVAFFKDLKIFNTKGNDVTNNSKFKKCWIVTINGVLHLWDNLKASGFEYLKTRRLNQDCIENFFGSVRQQGGNCPNPTPIQFERAFKKLFTQNYLHTEGMNCRNDIDELLTNLKASDKTQTTSLFVNNEDIHYPGLRLDDYEYRKENLPTQNAFTYVCGYLMKKCLDKHTCETCKKFANDVEDLDFSRLFSHFKSFDDKSLYGGLKMPSEQFVRYIYQLEKNFSDNFKEIYLTKRISYTYFNIMQKIPFPDICSHFPLRYLLKLFIRLRLFYSLKYCNRQMKSTGQTRNRKISILSHI